MAWARTVAVVVPSPAMSLVLLATSFTIWAPMFSRVSLSSISLATVTPSLVMSGEPNFLSMTTLRPLGPRVTLTASARTFTPRRIDWRDSSPWTICFAIALTLLTKFAGAVPREPENLESPGAGRGPSTPRLARSAQDDNKAEELFQDAEDFFLAHDEELFAIDLDFGTGILAKEDAVAGFHLQRGDFTFFVLLAFADGDDFAFLRLVLGGIGDDDAATGGLGFFDATNDDAVVEGNQFGCGCS